MWISPARLSGQDGPRIKVLDDRRGDGKRYLSLEISSPRKAPRIDIVTEGANVLASSAQHVTLAQNALGPWRFTAYGMGDTPVPIDLVLQDGAPFAVRVSDLSYGLPPTELPARPASMMIQPFLESDTTSIMSRITFK
jgi:hypothetical protein